MPVENSKGEWGLGQHELNVRYAEALDMADRHVVFKQCLKEIAEQHGHARHVHGEVRRGPAGSSCHIHLSLWRDGTNAFAGTRRFGPVKCSDAFRWFLGGWIAHVPEVMVFYAPTVNSYKRYVDASWAPTRLAWSYDNRTAGFRVVGDGPSLRIECRIPGADCNPYLAFAAVARLGPRRHRAIGPSRPTASPATSMRRGTCRACRTTLARRDRGVRRERVREAKPSATTSSSTTATSSGPKQRAYRRGRHRLGAPAVLRAHLIDGTRLQGKVALITGAGSGIGRESALLFAAKARRSSSSIVDDAAAQETVDADHGRRRPRGRTCTPTCRAPTDCERMVAAAESEFGGLHVLFNNAGIMHSRDDDAVSTDEEMWDLTMNINAKGVFLGCKYGIPALRRAGGGAIINTASFVAVLGAATPQVAYTASKGAVLALTRELAVVHARENIRVNALCPGPLRTELLMKFLDTEAKKQRRLVHIPMGRFGEATEIAQAALFLASDESSYRDRHGVSRRRRHHRPAVRRRPEPQHEGHESRLFSFSHDDNASTSDQPGRRLGLRGVRSRVGLPTSSRRSQRAIDAQRAWKRVPRSRAGGDLPAHGRLGGRTRRPAGAELTLADGTAGDADPVRNPPRVPGTRELHDRHRRRARWQTSTSSQARGLQPVHPARAARCRARAGAVELSVAHVGERGDSRHHGGQHRDSEDGAADAAASRSGTQKRSNMPVFRRASFSISMAATMPSGG